MRDVTENGLSMKYPEIYKTPLLKMSEKFALFIRSYFSNRGDFPERTRESHERQFMGGRHKQLTILSSLFSIIAFARFGAGKLHLIKKPSGCNQLWDTKTELL